MLVKTGRVLIHRSLEVKERANQDVAMLIMTISMIVSCKQRANYKWLVTHPVSPNSITRTARHLKNAA